MRLGLPSSMGRWRKRLAWPGALGGGLLAMCLGLVLSMAPAAHQRLDAARDSVASLQARITRAGQATNDPVRPEDEQLAAFYRIFPGEDEAVDWIGRIAAIARRDGLDVLQAEYQVVHDKAGKLTRLEMSLPLRDEYQKVRQFLADLRAEIAFVSLAQIQFERHKVGDPQVDVKLRLVIFLGRPS